MSTINDSVKSSCFGIFRGFVVQMLVYPIGVIKTHQQRPFNKEKSYQVGIRLLRNEGISGLYRGLSFQLVNTSVKQAWCWPMITGIPTYLEKQGMGTFEQQTLTGLSIATVDASLSLPLERERIKTVLMQRNIFSFELLIKEGGRGFATHWAKHSVQWSTFLVAQKHFREQSRDCITGKELSVFQLVKVGIKIGVVVSLLSAPFDVANMIKLSKSAQLSYLFSGNVIRNFYRGWPLSFFALSIQNSASVILIEKLGK